MTNREFRKFAFKIIFTRNNDKHRSSGKEAVNSSLGFISSADRSIKQSQYISSLNSSLSHLNRREISSHESMSHQSVSHPEISFDDSFNTSTTTAYSSTANRLTPSIESHPMGLSPPTQHRGHQPTPAPMQKHANLHTHAYHQRIVQFQNYHASSLSQSSIEQSRKEQHQQQQQQQSTTTTEPVQFKGRRIRRASSLQSDDEVKTVQTALNQKTSGKHWRRASMPRVESNIRLDARRPSIVNSNEMLPGTSDLPSPTISHNENPHQTTVINL